MKIVVANAVRSKYLDIITKALADEDVGMIASNAINLPFVTEDGEEGWVEITVKVPKESGDEGYGKREEYTMKCAEREAKAKEKAEAKARKIERDKAEREARKAAKEKEKGK